MNKLLLFLVIFGFASSLYPVSQNEVYIGTACSALGAGLITHAASRSIVADIIVSAGSGALAYYILNHFTPEGRLARAQTRIERIERNPFAMREFESDQDLIEAIQEVYVLYDLYLMAAYADIALLIEQGYEALSLVEAARNESNFDLNIIQRCDVLISRITHALSLMKTAVKSIRSNSEYLTQCKMYKDEQAAKALLAVQQQIANAQTHQAYYR